MGCVCCSLSSFVSILLNAAERVTLCTVCAMLVCCLLFTILTVMVMGIGIGFHYCTVQHSVEGMEAAAKAAGALRSEGGPGQSPVMRSVNKAVKRGFAHRLGKRDKADQLMPSNNNTINDDLLRQNITVFGDRLRQVLAGPNNIILNSTDNDTLLYNISLLNIRYPDEVQQNLTVTRSRRSKREVGNDTTVHYNMTIEEARLIRQNCTLLTFFNRFF